MEVALIEIPVHILEGLHRNNLISKESYTVQEVYDFGRKQQPEYVKKMAEVKILKGEITERYNKINEIFKTLENDTQQTRPNRTAPLRGVEPNK